MTTENQNQNIESKIVDAVSEDEISQEDLDSVAGGGVAGGIARTAAKTATHVHRPHHHNHNHNNNHNKH